MCMMRYLTAVCDAAAVAYVAMATLDAHSPRRSMLCLSAAVTSTACWWRCHCGRGQSRLIVQSPGDIADTHLLSAHTPHTSSVMSSISRRPQWRHYQETSYFCLTIAVCELSNNCIIGLAFSEMANWLTYNIVIQSHNDVVIFHNDENITRISYAREITKLSWKTRKLSCYEPSMTDFNC